MKLFDKVKEFLNPKIRKEFNTLIEKHSEALKNYIEDNYKPRKIIAKIEDQEKFTLYDNEFTLRHKLFVKDWDNNNQYNYAQKVFLLKRKDQLLDLQSIYTKYLAIKSEVRVLTIKHPHAVILFCKNKFKVDINFKYNNGEKVTFPRNYTQNDIYLIQGIDDLVYEQEIEILKSAFSIQQKENDILKEFEKEKTHERFEIKILKHKLRNKYYEKYLNTIAKPFDEKFCIEHLSEIDTFIKRQIKQGFEVLKKKYPHGIETAERNNRENILFGEGFTKKNDFKEYCIESEDEIRKLNDIELKYLDVKSKYPHGVEIYENKFQEGFHNIELIGIPSRKQVVNLDEDELKKYEEKYSTIQNYNEWKPNQESYSSRSRNLHNTILQEWGCYYYDIEFPPLNNNDRTTNEKYRIWQHFYFSFCAEKDLSLYYYEKYKGLSRLKKHTEYFDNDLYDQIINFIYELKNNYGNIQVFFGDSNLGIKTNSFNKFHFDYLKEQLVSKQISCGNELFPTNNHIVIVEVITTNKNLKDQCNNIISTYKRKCPNITYISLEKGFDRNEMLELIEEENREVENKERKEDEELKKKNEYTDFLFSCTSQWKTHGLSAIKHKWLYEYYSYRDYKDYADSEMWNAWKMIWHFKNDPDASVPVSKFQHEEKLNLAILWVEKVLEETFGQHLINITLVCITASTKLKNELRFKCFAERVCADLNMSNAYKHINIISDGQAKHKGGTKASKKTYDDAFFKERYIILFDDIRTSGRGLEKEKKILEKLGATVIGAITLGQTMH